MIEHLSGSSMNMYEKEIHNFYTRYVLGEEPIYCVNVKNAMEFGKQYELGLLDGMYKGYDTQKVCEMIIGGYKVYGLFDFYREGKYRPEVIECKTRNRWWSHDEIHKSWQFRIYNYWCWNNHADFSLHEYNKKEEKFDILDIKRRDETFIDDFLEKAGQIERFLKSFNVELKRYDIQKD